MASFLPIDTLFEVILIFTKMKENKATYEDNRFWMIIMLMMIYVSFVLRQMIF